MIEKFKDAIAILILIAFGLMAIMIVCIFIIGVFESVIGWSLIETVQVLLMIAALLLIGLSLFFILAWAENRINKIFRK